MARVAKYTENMVPWELGHGARTNSETTNPDIDEEKHDKNYMLSPDRGMSAFDYYKSYKESVYCYGRKDVNTLAEWVVTAPKNLSVAQEQFFGATQEFLTERYGVDNNILTAVHNDESGQPHMHYYFVPVVPDSKHGGMKVCCNDVISRKELRSFHGDYQNFLESRGIYDKIYTGITARQGGNRSVYEMKKERDLERSMQRDVKIEKPWERRM